MASLKTRRLSRNTGGIAVGVGGSTVSKLLFGAGAVTAISCAAASAGSALMTVTGASLGDKVFISTGSMAACAWITGACVTATNVLTLKYFNSGSATMADTPLSVQYLVIS